MGLSLANVPTTSAIRIRAVARSEADAGLLIPQTGTGVALASKNGFRPDGALNEPSLADGFA